MNPPSLLGYPVILLSALKLLFLFFLLDKGTPLYIRGFYDSTERGGG